MSRSPYSALAPLLLLTTALIVTAAHANPSLDLTDPDQFSEDATLVTFADMAGSTNGDPVTESGGLSVYLTDGDPALYIFDPTPREMGDPEASAVNNFWGRLGPRPAVVIDFPGVVHRMAFEARASGFDDIVVTLLTGSEEIVDQVAFASPDRNLFYFYGLENADGFESVEIDAEGMNGAFEVDNVLFESFEPPEPLDAGTGTASAGLQCSGFFEMGKHLPKESKASHKHRKHHKHSRKASRKHERHWSMDLDGEMKPGLVRKLGAQIVDAEDFIMTDEDMGVPPVARVLYSESDDGATMDVTAKVVKHAPKYNGHGFWTMRLHHPGMKTPGVYEVTLESGDEAEYSMDPGCAAWVVLDAKASKKSKKKHH